VAALRKAGNAQATTTVRDDRTKKAVFAAHHQTTAYLYCCFVGEAFSGLPGSFLTHKAVSTTSCLRNELEPKRRNG